MAKKRASVQKERTVLDETGWVEWSEIGPDNWNPREERFRLRLYAGFTYTLRLFHRPVRFWRAYFPDNTARIVAGGRNRPAVEGATVVVCRYAIHVVDRADGQFKLLEESEALFLEFRRSFELTGIDPGGPEGFDFMVQVVDLKATPRFHVSFDHRRPTPLTDAERRIVAESWFNLSLLFCPNE